MGESQLDQELVERVQKGDTKAFDLLVRKYQHRIVALVSRYVNDHSECQDVAQEAFIRAWHAIDKFRGDSAFYTWLYTIATNTAKNYLVARKRRPPSDDVNVDDAVYGDSAAFMSDLATPDHVLMRQEIEQTVLAAVQELPDELREAITLREMNGLSYEEIATSMQCPVGTVRSRIFRARDAINKQLETVITGKSESDHE